MVAGFMPRAYAYKLARGIDKKLNRYIAYSGMIGLGARSAGQRAGMPSIAAEIIESLPGYASMLCAFHVDGKFVVIAVRNGVILHDMLFTNEADARTKYAELTEIPDWNALIAPAEWGMPRAVDRNLEDILSGTNHGVLRPISRVGAGAMSFLLLLIFALLFLYFFREPINQMFAPKPQVAKINPELAEEYKKQLEEKNKELDKEYNIRQEQVVEPLVMPFDSLPDVTERADLCFKAIGFLMQPVTGWIQVSAECNEAYVNAIFRRSFGTLDDFYAIAADIMPGVFVQEISDNEISVRAKLPARDGAPSRDLRDADTIMRELTSRFQAVKMNVNMDIHADIVANNTQSQEIYAVQISAESKMIPYEFMQIFYDFDGVYMTKASWNMIKKIWNYEVIIYAN
jgi:hypothetical protein